MLKLNILFASAIVCVGCEGVDDAINPPSTPETFEIAISTGPCFGTCPVFDVSIDQSGLVNFEGHDFVAQEGPASKRVPAEDARTLYAALLEAGFWELRAAYQTAEDGCVQLATDHPSTDWKVVVDGETKTVDVYHGCKGLPELDRLAVVEDLLVEKTAIAEWIGK